MTECTNDEMRDLLPLLAHGSLEQADAARVRTHAQACVACGAELAALETARLVLRASAPRVDTAAIAQAVTARLAATPALRVERGGAARSTVPTAVPSAPAPIATRASVWRSRQWLAAAASILIVATVAMPFLGNGTSEGTSVVRDTLVAAATPATSTAQPVALPSSAEVGESFTDLSDADLSTLLAELEQVEATIALEPTSLRQPIVDGPEGR